MLNQKDKNYQEFITILIVCGKNEKLIKRNVKSSSYGNRWLDVFPGKDSSYREFR